MKIRSVILGVLAASFSAFIPAPLVQAQNQKAMQEILYLKECPSEKSGDPSLVADFSVQPGKKCDTTDAQTLYAIEDTRLGLRWHMGPNGISINVEVTEPSAADIAATMKSCLKIGPNRTYVDEWLVPEKASCDNRGPFVGRHRRYVNSRVCLVGTFNCILVSALRPVGQARVQAVLDRLQRPVAQY